MISNKKNMTTALIVIFWFCVWLYLSYITPMIGEDLKYRKFEMTREPVHNVIEIFTSTWDRFHVLDGRLFASLCITTVMMLPPFFYVVANACVATIVGIVIAEFAVVSANGAIRENGYYPFVLFMSEAAFYFFMPDFSTVILIRNGCITYTWGNCIILFFMLLYYKDMMKKTNGNVQRNSGMRALAIACLGLIAGLWVEPSACALVAFLLYYYMWNVKKGFDVSIQYGTGICSVILGVGLMFLAPGNRVRVDMVHEFESSNIIFAYAWRIARLGYYSCRFLLFPFAIFLALYVGQRFRKRESKNVIENIIEGSEGMFVLIALVSTIVMVFSSGFSVRTLQFPVMCFIIAIMVCFSRMSVKFKAVGLLESARTFSVCLCVMVVVELVSGTLYSRQEGYEGYVFNRRMFYVSGDESSLGVMQGIGVNKDVR